MPELVLGVRDLVGCEVDVLVVGVTTDGSAPRAVPGLEALDKAFEGRLDQALAEVGATGSLGDVVRLPSLGAVCARTVIGVGLGRGEVTAGLLRDAAGTAVRAAAGASAVALALPATTPDEVAAVALGAALGAYAFDEFRSKTAEERKAPVTAVHVLVEEPAAHDLDPAATLAEAVCFARDLVNVPPHALGPAELADSARVVAQERGLDCAVLDADDLLAGGYGGLLAVGSGSPRRPCLVRLDYRHPDATTTLSLVGKGITFDSGGLNLKPGKSMETMKMDMAGAAAVLAALAAVSRLRLPVNVTGWLALAENMPSGQAMRPSDVIVQYGGTTVEILDTDAEGRLVLADVLARSSQDKPDVLVDVATLTGAVMAALGMRTIGVMSDDAALRTLLAELGEEQGEPVWPLPLPAYLAAGLSSKVADLVNVSEDKGGALTAAMFLKEFVGEGVRWAHLDIAGPAFNAGSAHGCTPAGGTGAAVRVLVALARSLCAVPSGQSA